ncbi:MAG: LPS assembly protein LptD [Vicinamibacteria bacterium]
MSPVRALRVLSLFAASAAFAQEPQTSPTPVPAPVLAPAPSPTPTPVTFEDPPLGADELRIRANRTEGKEGKVQYEGFVDLRFGQLRIQADSLNMFDETKPDGTSAQRIEATGNVVFMSGQERISGETLRLDLDTGKGIFTKASGYLQPDVLFEADSIERVDSDTYKLKGARFTACTQPTPRWMFKAHSATVDVDKWIKATLVDLQIKGIPTPLVLPYIQFPINPDKRSTGLLIPRYSSSTGTGAGVKGRGIGLDFFWAMGRSADQTFYYDYYSKYGTGLGHELRYIRNANSRGNFRSYFTKQKGATKFQYDLDWSASQALPHRFKATLSANFYSNLLNQQSLQDSLDYSSTRTRRGSVGIQGSIGPAYVKLEGDTNDVYFYNGSNLSIQRRRHLPQLRINQSPKKIGKSGIAFGYEATAERLAQGSGSVDETSTDVQQNSVILQEYSRIDVAPQLTRTFSVPFLQVTPKALVRYTRYGASNDDEGGITGPALGRQFFEGSVEMRGPKLFKIFRLPGDIYSEKFKHTFEPEFVYTYRSNVEGFNNIPSFDYNDVYPKTNQLRYGLTNRIYAKKTGPAGKLVTHEFINWRLSQTYYFDISQNQNQFDPTYYSAIFNSGPGGAASHKSPIQSNLSVRPTLSSTVSFSTEYNPNFKQISSLSLSARLNNSRMSVQGGWSKNVNLAANAADRTVAFDTVRASGKVALWPERLTVEGSLTYDRVRKLMLQSTTRVRYGIQCCGFAVERINYNTPYRKETKTTFQIELAGIGAAGNLLGDNPNSQTNAGRK